VIGLAASPGTDVLPTYSIVLNSPGSAATSSAIVWTAAARQGRSNPCSRWADTPDVDLEQAGGTNVADGETFATRKQPVVSHDDGGSAIRPPLTMRFRHAA
jgi:hypothetical protein